MYRMKENREYTDERDEVRMDRQRKGQRLRESS